MHSCYIRAHFSPARFPSCTSLAGRIMRATPKNHIPSRRNAKKKPARSGASHERERQNSAALAAPGYDVRSRIPPCSRKTEPRSGLSAPPPGTDVTGQPPHCTVRCRLSPKTAPPPPLINAAAAADSLSDYTRVYKRARASDT